MTSEEFEIAYAKRSNITLEELREFRTVRPCDCGEDGCNGWQSISHERAKEYDAEQIEEKGPGDNSINDLYLFRSHPPVRS